jgi:Xaa-Pro dipeptidase
MPQAPNFPDRIARLQAVLKERGIQAVILESGPGMMYFTGVRWGRSERTFAVIIPRAGLPLWVLPGFEEARARELIRPGDEIRIWEEDKSPFQRIVDGLKARGIAVGKVGVDDNARFFVFDGIRRLAPKLDYIGVLEVLKEAGMG